MKIRVVAKVAHETPEETTYTVSFVALVLTGATRFNLNVLKDEYDTFVVNGLYSLTQIEEQSQQDSEREKELEEEDAADPYAAMARDH